LAPQIVMRRDGHEFEDTRLPVPCLDRRTRELQRLMRYQRRVWRAQYLDLLRAMRGVADDIEDAADIVFAIADEDAAEMNADANGGEGAWA
jgi:hypothetical protein